MRCLGTKPILDDKVHSLVVLSYVMHYQSFITAITYLLIKDNVIIIDTVFIPEFELNTWLLPVSESNDQQRQWRRHRPSCVLLN